MAQMLGKDTGQEQANSFCTNLLQILRLVRLYDTDNVTFEDPINRFKTAVINISDRMGAARLQSEEGMLYFNKEPVRGGRRMFNTIQGLVNEMERDGFAEIASKRHPGAPAGAHAASPAPLRARGLRGLQPLRRRDL